MGGTDLYIEAQPVGLFFDDQDVLYEVFTYESEINCELGILIYSI